MSASSYDLETFDLLTAKVDRFVSLPPKHLSQFASKSVQSFSNYLVHKFGDGRTDGRTGGHVENIIRPASRLAEA